MPRADRLVELVTLLSGRRAWPMQELVDQLGVSERTIYRDINHLSTRVPVTRVDEGYRLLETATLRPLRLTAAEHTILDLALDSPVLRKTPSLARRLATLRAKLEAVSSEAEETPAALALAGLDRTGRTPPDLMPALESAIADGRAVAIVYASLSGGSERQRGVDPYRLFHRGDAWYLVGRCHVHDEPRTFRLDRIRELAPLDERFRVPPDFSLDDYLEDAWSVFRGGRTYDIVLRFDGDLAPLIQNAEHHAGEEVQAVAGGELEYRVRLNHLDEIARWIVGFGGRCRVVKPETLRRKVCELAAGAGQANSPGR